MGTAQRVVVEVGRIELFVERRHEGAFCGLEFEAGVRFADLEESHPFGEVPRQADVWILIRADGDDGGFWLLELWVEDVCHLGDDGLHVRNVGLAVEAVDGLKLGEVGLSAEFEGKIL